MTGKFDVSTAKFLAIGNVKRIKSDEKMTLETIENAYKTAAYITTHYGDQYLPIFARLHDELEKVKSLNALKNAAHEIAKENEW